ncbi:Serine protease, subtilisin family [Sinosporangium album]|uniref:alpha-amylase n=1 Tax=Sinosporangium album TaxID=504805 RepID=A0A1G8BP28_9ACTN|nr:S8 family serine peptidase [Sinosporangium album]SDH34824.1 Serine protease, subtilisin family [Sinosporangium album]
MVSGSRRWRMALVGAATAAALLLPQGVAQAAPSAGSAGADTIGADRIGADRKDAEKIDKALAAELAKGPATFLVRVKGDADLSEAARLTSKADKAARVFAAKHEHADASQAGLRRLLTEKKAKFTPLWIVNAVTVTGDADLAAEIAKLPEVERVEADAAVPMPKPQVEAKAAAPGSKAKPAGWNLDAIGASKVWNEFGVRGEGVVVAALDGGAQFDHPALADRYRGKKADGTVDHNYNWYEPGNYCLKGVPCITGRNGTSIIGAAVGEDRTGSGASGVAPGAKWIMTRGCAFDQCNTSALMQAAEWLVAPTDVNGRGPRPDLAPDIVMNIWGHPYTPWFTYVVDAWVAAGIFPVFGAGDRGPACNTSTSPGDHSNAYSVGAVDANGTILHNSGRGAGENGEVKPNITAPGSARVPTFRDEYAEMSGTAVASAHVAGAVALLWSAAPSLKRDLTATRELLNRTAVDVNDTSCGGTAAKNNTYGEGRLDVHAAVREALSGPAGTVKGAVASGGAPAESVTVSLSGPVARKVVTGADGAYSAPRLPAGAYKVTARKHGYGTASASVTVAADQTATHDVSLTLLPTHTVSGTVTSGGTPEAGASVEIADTTTKAVTDAAGRYRLTVPSGDHSLAVTPRAGSCAGGALAAITVNTDLTKDIAAPRRTDDFGYTCTVGTGAFVGGKDRHPESGQTANLPVTLPFAFSLYGWSTKNFWVNPKGYVIHQPMTDDPPTVEPIPSLYGPSGAVYPYYTSDGRDTEVYTATVGTAPNRSYVIEWRKKTPLGRPYSVSAVLSENGSAAFHYKGVGVDGIDGRAATVGLESRLGNDGFQFSRNQAGSVGDNQVVTFTPTRHGVLSGSFTDANDGRPLAYMLARVGTTYSYGDADGDYALQLPAGDHQVTFEGGNYGAVTQTVTVRAGEVTRADVSLTTGAVSASVSEVDLVMPPNSTRRGTFTLTNLGTAAATFTVEPDPARSWLSVEPARGELAPGASVTVTATADSTGIAPGASRTGNLRITSKSARNPVFTVPVTMVVPSRQIAVDVGGTREVVDSLGERWTADRAYATGGHGYVGARTRVATTTQTIRETSDQELFKQGRESMSEYRFDGLPIATYTVELGFAEVRGMRPGRRVFDVMAEGEFAVPALDLAQEVGTHTATVRRYTVKVVDGQLNLRFAARAGTPIVNTIRVTERPDAP